MTTPASKKLVFLVYLGIYCFDFVTDWWLFSDVNNTDKGLVFGPPIQAKKWSLLAFDIVGTVIFIFEVVNIWQDVFRSNPVMQIDTLSDIALWIEELPLNVINIFIVFCREEAISYWQLIKAGSIIAYCIFRLIKTLCKYFECCNSKGTKSCYHMFWSGFGLLINIGCAIVVFIFTQSERSLDGGITMKVPHNVFAGEYDEQKYFNDVGVYFSHPTIDYAEVSNASEIPMLRLATLSNIRDKSHDHIIKIQYDKNPTKVVHWEGNTIATLKATECFQIDSVNKKLKIRSSCAKFITTPKATEIIIKFHYVKAYYPGLIFGNILYNYRIYQNNTCTIPSFSVVDDLGKRIENVNNVFLRYYRSVETVSDASPVIHLASSEAQFFYTKDLVDIASVWKTGFGICDCTGNLSPVLDETIQVECT